MGWICTRYRSCTTSHKGRLHDVDDLDRHLSVRRVQRLRSFRYSQIKRTQYFHVFHPLSAGYSDMAGVEPISVTQVSAYKQKNAPILESPCRMQRQQQQ